MNQRSPVSQRQEPWQERTPSNSQSRQTVVSPSSMVSLSKDIEADQQKPSRQEQNPFRGRKLEQDISPSTKQPTQSDDKSQSISSTPRRKGNPQSPAAIVDSLELQRSRSNSSAQFHDVNVDLTTPLATLSTILTTTKSYHGCAIKNYRVNHKLFRDAKDRTTKGVCSSCVLVSCYLRLMSNFWVIQRYFIWKIVTFIASQALAQAKAEYEHATTAQGKSPNCTYFITKSLYRTMSTNSNRLLIWILEYAHSELTASLATKQQCETHTIQVEKQVRKLGQQIKGKQVKLVGLTQNVKWNGRTGVIVKLVVEGEDCGRWKVRLDKERRGGDPEGLDGRDSLNGEVRDGDVDRQQRNQDDVEEDEQTMAFHHVVAKAENLQLLEEIAPIGFDGGVLLTTSSGSTQSRSRSKSRTSSRSGTGSGSGKSRDPSTSRYSESLKAHSSHSNSKAGVTVAVTPDHQIPYRKNSMRSPLSPPEIREFASAFKNMLQSPVSFEQPSFKTDSFNSSSNRSEERMRIKSRSGRSGDVDRSYNKKSDSSIAGSFFDEVTPRDLPNQSCPHDEDKIQLQYHGHEPTHIQHHEDLCYHSVEGESHQGYPQEIYSTDLPTLVILPVQEDEQCIR